jgi:hypothetical protein
LYRVILRKLKNGQTFDNILPCIEEIDIADDIFALEPYPVVLEKDVGFFPFDLYPVYVIRGVGCKRDDDLREAE